MKCQEVMELMQRHLDGDLSQDETRVMQQHRSECLSCAAMFERLNRLSDELVQLPKVTPAFSIVDSILPQLAEIDRNALKAASMGQAVRGSSQQAPTAGWWARLRESVSIRALGGVAAAAVLFGLIVTNAFPMNDSLSNADDSASEQMYDGAQMESSASEPFAAMSVEGTSDELADSAADSPQAKMIAPAGGDAESMDVADQYGNKVDPNQPVEFQAKDSADAGSLDVAADSGTGNIAMPSVEAPPTLGEGSGQNQAFAAPEMAPVPPAESPADSQRSKGFVGTGTPTASEPVISPDGSLQAYVRSDGASQQVAVLRSEDGTAVITSGGYAADASIGGLTWKEDGSAVEFTVESSSGIIQTFRIDMKTLSVIETE